MGAGSIYSPDLQYVCYDFLYRRRPDGLFLPAGDVNHVRGTVESFALPAMLAASYYHDPYLAFEYSRRTNIDAHCRILELLWRDFDLEEWEPDDLPLTFYSGTPFGWMIARTGWGTNSVIAEMKINEHFVGNHQHMDGGAFQIYYKGPLAIDSGMYQGSSGGYNSPHNKNYAKRTIAHNSLLVYDPDEVFETYNYGGEDKTAVAANDGGQRMPGAGWNTCRSFKELLSK
jgi:heparin/heparan-sulfate lyase